MRPDAGSFAAHSGNLIWIGDPAADTIIYRSAAYERIWGVPLAEAPMQIAEWMESGHPDDRPQVEHALAALKAGEVTHVEYRIIRPVDGRVRWLRDTSFPIPDDAGTVTRIGGITEDLTQEDVSQVYIVSATAAEARRLADLVRVLGYRARTFDSAAAFLDLASVLAPGCVLVDLRRRRGEGLSIPRELRARSIPLPTVVLDTPGTDATAVVAAMKAGATDYVVAQDEASLRATLASALAECHGAVRPTTRDENAGARVARLTAREREVLVGLIEGGDQQGNRSEARDQPSHGGAAPRPGDEPPQRKQPDGTASDRSGRRHYTKPAALKSACGRLLVDHEDAVDAYCVAWTALTQEPGRIQSPTISAWLPRVRS